MDRLQAEYEAAIALKNFVESIEQLGNSYIELHKWLEKSEEAEKLNEVGVKLAEFIKCASNFANSYIEKQEVKE